MWYIILGTLTILYLTLNFILPNTFESLEATYIIRPLLFISLALTTLLIARHEGLNILKFQKYRKWDIGNNPLQAALLIGGFHIALLIIAGVFLGFGKSPYAHTPTGILTNLIFITTTILGIELSRAYLIKKTRHTKKYFTLFLSLIAFLFILFYIQPTEFLILSFNDPSLAIKFLGETIIPLFAISLFATYLAYLGGALTAIAYIGILQAFEWFSPVLPNLDWTMQALIGTIAPAIGFIIIQNSIQTTHTQSRKHHHTRGTLKDPALSWTAVAIISILLVFFSFGYLGVQPTAITTGSMRPTIDVGDLVFIIDTPTETIKTGDIIQYHTQNISLPIIHRVHAITQTNHTTTYITKGDANDAPDTNPVTTQQITGKAIFTIPKIGWISLLFKNLMSSLTIK